MPNNKKKNLFSKKVDSYWINKKNTTYHICPDVSLFRLIGSIFESLINKKILEIGIGRGADLIECNKRGAKVFGLDINPEYVNNIKSETKFEIQQFRAGYDSIPYDNYFDLIYSLNTIYYLTNEELLHFFSQCAEKLESHGKIIFQFIEADLLLSHDIDISKSDFNTNFLSKYKLHRIHNECNPIRFLNTNDLINIAMQSNLKFAGSKRLIQSYDLFENKIRVEKYIIFSRV